MAQTIKIKRSVTSNVPNNDLAEGELAYGHQGDDAGKLVIGRPLAEGDDASNDVIGGKFFVDQISNAASANTAERLVKRDASGNFSAGTVTASLTGNVTGDVTGNVSGSSGSCTGNAATATALASDITINSNTVNGGSTLTLDADDIAEAGNPTNKYFTNSRADGRVQTLLSHANHSNITATVDEGTGEVRLTASSQYSDSNARSALSGGNTGTGYGSLGYDNSTGAFTFTKVTDAEIKASASVLPSLSIAPAFDGTLPAGELTFRGQSGSASSSQVEISGGGNQHPFKINTFIKNDSENTLATILSSDRQGDDNDLFVGVNYDANVEIDNNFEEHRTIIGGGIYTNAGIKTTGDLKTQGLMSIIGSPTDTHKSLTWTTGQLSGGGAKASFVYNASEGNFKLKDKSVDVFTMPHSDNATGSTNFQIHRDTDITGDLSVSGDLTVSGGTTTITSTELAVGDAIITLNDDLTTSANSEDAGIEVNRGLIVNDPANTERAKAKFFFDESELEWKAQIPDETNSASFTTQVVLTATNVESTTFTVDGGAF